MTFLEFENVKHIYLINVTLFGAVDHVLTGRLMNKLGLQCQNIVTMLYNIIDCRASGANEDNFLGLQTGYDFAQGLPIRSTLKLR